MSLHIAIIGTRGVPNYYGGFEECAQQLGRRLVKMGHRVTVYNSHQHPYEHKQYQGIQIIHKYDPEKRLGTAGQFIYDLNCIIDSRRRDFEVILNLGYTSSSIWMRLFPSQVPVVTNMDGLEWKRSKYSPRVQKFLRLAERWAARGSDVLIADSREIQRYLFQKFTLNAVYIPYGAQRFKKPDPGILEHFNVQPGGYNLVIARLEPENNIEMILEGVRHSRSSRVMLVIGDHSTDYGRSLKKRFRDSRIRFISSTYHKEMIHNLRYHAHLYFHGHTVGGTNPSLLEAMACECVIVAHSNPFNTEVLGEDGNYFLDAADVSNALDHLERNALQIQHLKANLRKIKTRYQWPLVAEQYEITLQQAAIG